MFKDPYLFDFLGTADPRRERDVEDSLVAHIERFFTPKHASWLNMVEIEFGVMVRQCLSPRIAEKSTLVSEIAKWERRRNSEHARIDWMFRVPGPCRPPTEPRAQTRGVNRSQPLWPSTTGTPMALPLEPKAGEPYAAVSLHGLEKPCAARAVSGLYPRNADFYSDLARATDGGMHR